MVNAIRAREKSKGELVAVALRSAWRETPAPLELGAEELEDISTILLRSGAAGLVWWRASRTGFALSQLPESFLNAYKLQTLFAAVHLRNVKKAFSVLGSAGVEAVLVKGWAIARRYPQAALRPYVDLDICVRPEQFKLARQVLRESGAKNIWIDLHQGFGALDRESNHDLFECASVSSVGGVAVRVPLEEDHLRMLCLHLLRHGAWRPLWLCDIALALESRKEDFDWSRFYGPDPKRRRWLACVIDLAGELLHADTADVELYGMKRAPRWLVRSVLRRWSRWFIADHRDRALRSLLHYRFEPARALEDLYFRFDPLRATVEMNGRFNRMPRLPYQLVAVLRRFSDLPAKMTNLLDERVSSDISE